MFKKLKETYPVPYLSPKKTIQNNVRLKSNHELIQNLGLSALNAPGWQQDTVDKVATQGSYLARTVQFPK